MFLGEGSKTGTPALEPGRLCDSGSTAGVAFPELEVLQLGWGAFGCACAGSW